MKLSLDTLLDQEFEGRHRAERVLNSEVSYVRYLIGWIAKTFDYINRVKLTLRLLVYEGTWTHSPPLVAMHLLDRSCVIVGIFLKLHATFPNRSNTTRCTFYNMLVEIGSHLKGGWEGIMGAI